MYLASARDACNEDRAALSHEIDCALLVAIERQIRVSRLVAWHLPPLLFRLQFSVL